MISEMRMAVDITDRTGEKRASQYIYKQSVSSGIRGKESVVTVLSSRVMR